MPDIPPPSTMPSKAHVARFKAEMQTRRLARLLNATIRGGLWCGAIGGVYYAVQGLSEYARQEEDAYNTVFGSWAAGGVMGAACEFSWTLRMLNNNHICSQLAQN